MYMYVSVLFAVFQRAVRCFSVLLAVFQALRHAAAGPRRRVDAQDEPSARRRINVTIFSPWQPRARDIALCSLSHGSRMGGAPE